MAEDEVEQCWRDRYANVGGHLLEEFQILDSKVHPFYMVFAYYVRKEPGFSKKRSISAVTVFQKTCLSQAYYKKIYPEWIYPSLDENGGVFACSMERGIFYWNWDSRRDDCKIGWMLGT